MATKDPITPEELLETILAAAESGAKSLRLEGRGIRALPAEIGRLHDLGTLELANNALTKLSPEIGGLRNLNLLALNRNALTELPPEIGILHDLETLYLDGNSLSELPPEIGQLTKLQTLYLTRNKFEEFPRQLAGLTSLRSLALGDNRLRSGLEYMSKLTGLRKLWIWGLSDPTLFPDVGMFRELTFLDAGRNGFNDIPPEVCSLENLSNLGLYNNKLTTLLPEIGKLSALSNLNLSKNRLTTLPSEIGKLSGLSTLDLSGNQLTTLPPEIGYLTELKSLNLDGNPLISPPPEIVAQGVEAIQAYLRGQSEQSQRRWVSKLLVVGEGGVGKTSVLRALRGEEFDEQESTTRGIEIRPLTLDHPSETDVEMGLNCWDFGGQEIYHATHQFFLTKRSLYLLVWNARLGFEQGKLFYWLDMIRARAPGSPVFIVATHIDQRTADLPIADIKADYPQVAGFCAVSCMEGTDIDTLRNKITELAAGLPLMGEIWPSRWLEAAQDLEALSEQHISAKQLAEVFERHGIPEGDQSALGTWLHDLGSLLHFRDDPELEDVVILDPHWVTARISRVLEHKGIKDGLGIFHRKHAEELWSDVESDLQEHLLALMEQFDLSYRTLTKEDISIVVERLSQDRPQDLAEKWARFEGQPEISMVFRMATAVPAGIPTWFVARTHRFTTYTHWLYGALFERQRSDVEAHHAALVQAHPHDRYLKLTVRGPAPQNFFALLKDGVETTLARFPGMDITPMVPCPGHGGEPCPHEFAYADLRRRIERKKPRYSIECPRGIDDVDVRTMLYGLVPGRHAEILSKLDELQGENREQHKLQMGQLGLIRELTEWQQREFIRDFEREQRLIESHTPSVFLLSPKRGRSGWQNKLFGQVLELSLFCEAPGEWHPVQDGGQYEIPASPDWLAPLAPHLYRLAKVLRYVGPFVGPAAAIVDDDWHALFEDRMKLMTELVKRLPTELDAGDRSLIDLAESPGPMHRATGAQLRGVRTLLDEHDTARHWGGLSKFLTPENHYLWLCPNHLEHARRRAPAPPGIGTPIDSP